MFTPSPTGSPTTSAPAPIAPPPATTTSGPIAPPPPTSAPIAPTQTPIDPAPVEPEPTEPAAEECAAEGDPVIPQTETGWFPANSNQSCFQGSWYCFEDDVVDTSCVTGETPWDATASAMCVTGETIERTDPEDFTQWGAGIGASLNDQDGDKEAFDAEAAGIVGFKFTITGELDGATLLFMIPLTTKSTEQGPPEYVAKVGANTVMFEDVVQPEWAGTDEANPQELYELKWQIKGGDTTSSYNFCVTDVEPIYE